jgi:hypothetical protein
MATGLWVVYDIILGIVGFCRILRLTARLKDFCFIWEHLIKMKRSVTAYLFPPEG